MKDKLITKNYIEILAANFLLFFGFWLLMPVLPFYLAEVFENNHRGRTFLLHHCRPVHTAFLRLSVRYICPQTTLSVGLFHFYRHLRRISHCRNTNLIYFIPHYTRSIIRHGDSQRKYHCHWYHAFFTSWGRIRILWAGKQYSHVHRTDDRTLPTWCRSRLYAYLLLLIRFLPDRISMRLIGKDHLQTSCKTRTDIIGPLYFA